MGIVGEVDIGDLAGRDGDFISNHIFAITIAIVQSRRRRNRLNIFRLARHGWCVE